MKSDSRIEEILNKLNKDMTHIKKYYIKSLSALFFEIKHWIN